MEAILDHLRYSSKILVPEVRIGKATSEFNRNTLECIYEYSDPFSKGCKRRTDPWRRRAGSICILMTKIAGLAFQEAGESDKRS